eukprot:TRINITY_DN547_c0_g2_i1.p1 TRINITY_DN547_c0_g2~~TRINITY_DN547_c0_g2_i1.p1  ORF type:complete len:351 (-),score=76.80 TRINITY_DN547_c0_g2_i1:222-1274(-)
MAALCCGAQRSADSAAIDTQLKKELASEKHAIRILILGTSASGKSTVAKQMKIIHSNGFTNEELENYKQILILNIFNGMKELVLQAEGLNIKVTRKNKKVATYFVEVNPYTEKLDAETVAKAKQLWADSGLQKMWNRRNEIDFPTNLEYMMANIDRFAEPDFVPSNDDVLHARQRTTGVVETQFTVDKFNWTLIDVGGQRSERRKWMHFFTGVAAVIYCAALDEFDMVCPEEPTKNKMEESLEVFEKIINGDFFKDIAFILFLNKRDLFKTKVEKMDLSTILPNYNAGHDYDQAVAFIKNMYMSKVRNRPLEEVYVHVTCAIDTNNCKFVFDAVSETIFTKRLQVSGLLS